VAPARRVYKLGGDPNSITNAADRSFQHRTHPEFTADIANIDRTSLIGETRVARDDHQARDLRQIRDDVFADAVGKILLLRITRHVGEEQHSNRRLVWNRYWRGALRQRLRSVGLDAVNTNWPADIFQVSLAGIEELGGDLALHLA
jgi:hypothetical protein